MRTWWWSKKVQCFQRQLLWKKHLSYIEKPPNKNMVDLIKASNIFLKYSFCQIYIRSFTWNIARSPLYFSYCPPEELERRKSCFSTICRFPTLECPLIWSILQWPTNQQSGIYKLDVTHQKIKGRSYFFPQTKLNNTS